jgi:hypothetical protein
MLIRQKFVTNSSSTSFIGWGIPIKSDILEKQLSTIYPDDFEDLLDELYDGDPVMRRSCRESGWSYIIVSASHEKVYDGPWYMRLQETYTAEDQWKESLLEWCKEHKIECDDPHWIFATVY